MVMGPEGVVQLASAPETPKKGHRLYKLQAVKKLHTITNDISVVIYIYYIT